MRPKQKQFAILLLHPVSTLLVGEHPHQADAAAVKRRIGRGSAQLGIARGVGLPRGVSPVSLRLRLRGSSEAAPGHLRSSLAHGRVAGSRVRSPVSLPVFLNFGKRLQMR